MGSQLLELVRQNAVLLIVVLGIVGAFVFLRTRGTRLESVDAFDALLGTGQPVVVEFYSNTWTPCLMAKPIVDGIESDLEGRARVVRLSVLSEVGLNAARRYGVRSVPTILVFDGTGELVAERAGIPNRGGIVEQVLALAD